MSALRQSLADYLRVRRALGFKLRRDEKLLEQFIIHLENLGETHVTTRMALGWATLPSGAHRSWLSLRLSMIRGFATHLHAIDSAHEVPPADLLPWKRCRVTPYLYSDEEVVAVMTAAATLSTPHRVATYQTLIGLLSVTGMRVGEAIALDCADFDSSTDLVVVRKGKFGKSRELPLQASAAHALTAYLGRRDRPRSRACTAALLVSSAGTRLRYGNVQATFRRLVTAAGLTSRSPRCRPTLHSFRHSFAVRTMLDGYRDGDDTQARLALLSTYLGHVDPGKTYWYLSAAPELVELSARRLEQHLRGDS
jgi:integrase